MDRKQYLMDMRTQGLLKGQMPCFVTLRDSYGRIYTKEAASFIMSLRGEYLYFQKMTRFFHKLDPKGDFKFPVRRAVSYGFITKSRYTILFLYDKDEMFLPIEYMTGTRETFSTEENISRIVKKLEEMGIHPRKEQEDARKAADTGTKEPVEEIRVGTEAKEEQLRSEEGNVSEADR